MSFRLRRSPQAANLGDDDSINLMKSQSGASIGRSDDAAIAMADGEDVRLDVEPAVSFLGGQSQASGGGYGSVAGPNSVANSAPSVAGNASPFAQSNHGGMPEHFRKQLLKKQLREFVFELKEDGTSGIRETTVRDLYEYVQACISPYGHMTTRRMSMESSDGHVHSDGISPGGVRAGAYPEDGAASNAPSPAAAANAAALNVHYGYDSREQRPSTASSRPNGGGLVRQATQGAFISSLYLHSRDLRKMFAITSNSEPSIQVRRNVVLMNFEVLRAIVLVDRVILLLQAGADSVVSDFARTMKEFEDEHTAVSETVEFEMRAMEAVLSVSAHWLEREVEAVQPRVNGIVHAMEGPGNTATSPEANDSFRALKINVSELETRAKARRRALLQVLEEDEDLALMNLTKMKNDPIAYEMPLKLETLEDHEEVELLLEAFLQEINSLSNKLEILRERLLNTESLVMVRLDIARNRLLTANTIFAVATMLVASATLLTGVFGMNLRSNHEDSHHWFKVVIAVTALVTTVPLLLIFYWMRSRGLLF